MLRGKRQGKKGKVLVSLDLPTVGLKEPKVSQHLSTLLQSHQTCPLIDLLVIAGEVGESGRKGKVS